MFLGHESVIVLIQARYPDPGRAATAPQVRMTRTDRTCSPEQSKPPPMSCRSTPVRASPLHREEWEMTRKTACTRVEKKRLDEGTMARAVLAILAVGMILGVLIST